MCNINWPALFLFIIFFFQIVPSKEVPLRKPGTDNDPNYDLIDDEEVSLIPKDVVSNRDLTDGKINKVNKEKSISLRTMVITILILMAITVIIIIVIIYLLCQKKTKQKKYLYASRRNVLTFSNPNYNASSGGDVGATPQPERQDKKGFIWKRLKYDKSQVG